MDSAFKKQLIARMRTEHRHESMTDASKCSSCGNKFQSAKEFYNRNIRQHPELLIRKQPEEPMSQERQKRLEQMEARLKRDPMYKEHLKKTFFGTPAEKERERKRANSGFYTKHSDMQTKKIW